MADLLGQHLGNYRLIRLLGKGSFADVYLGKHIYLKSEAAIKVLYGRLDHEAIEHFLTEARHLRVLEHPHIIRVHDFGVEEETPFLVMDYAPGGTLRDRHPRGKPLSLSQVVSYVQQIALALDYAHANKLVHRDLKPENLLLDVEEQVLLSDFGVALPLRTESMSVQTIGGTLAYMAPEQIRGRPCRESDQYALGIMVYEWLSGQRPFHGVAAELCGQHLFLPPPPLSEKVPDLPSIVEQVVQQALAKEPGERFPTVEAFADALAQAEQGKAPTLLFTKRVNELASIVDTEPGATRLETPRAHTSSNIHPKERFMQVPAVLTSLVGREHELQAASVLLVRPEVRLLTITGPGGIGKTRLALEIAHALSEVFAGGICFVELAALSDPDQVLTSIVQALDLKEGSETSPLDALKTFLKNKPFLLVLDNFEQVIDAAPLLLDLLTRCPELTLLVTSREVLHIPGEQNFPLVPLDLPTAEQLKDSMTLAQCSSIALFMQRAQVVNPAFEVTDTNKQAVAEICTRLDGLPLAVELAAARIKLLSPQVLLTRLSHRLDFLSTTARTMPERQHTVRKTIAWSYDLLPAAEQLLFRRLAVFVGGFSIADVEALYELLGEDPFSVLDGITSLVDKSLIAKQDQGDQESRLYLLETIRAFALEALSSAGALEATREAHAAYYLTLIAEVEPHLLYLPIGVGMDRLKLEYRNLQAALQFFREQQQSEGALRIAAALGAVGVWFLGGYMSEAVDLLRQTVTESRTTAQPASWRAEAIALFVIGWITTWWSDFEHGLPWFEECLAHFRQHECKQEIALLLVYISHDQREIGNYSAGEQAAAEGLALAREIGDQDCAVRHLAARLLDTLIRGEWAQTYALAQENLQMARERGDLWFEAFNLHYLGWAAYGQQSYTEAAAFGKKSVALFQQMGYPVWSAEALTQCAYEVAALGENDRAAQLLQEAGRVSQAGSDKRDQARALCGQARMALRQGDQERAQKLYEESVRLIAHHSQLEKRHRSIPACCLEGLAEIAIAQGQAVWAARLLGAAEAQRSFAPYSTPVGLEQGVVRRTQAIARADLGEASYNKAFAEGKRLTPLQALTAQGAADAEAGSQSSAAGNKIARLQQSMHTLVTDTQGVLPVTITLGESIPSESLTKREQDVLELLAEGLSNAEIAERLVLSVVTVNSYLRTVYSKLGVSSRIQAVRYAIDAHLVS